MPSDSLCPAAVEGSVTHLARQMSGLSWGLGGGWGVLVVGSLPITAAALQLGHPGVPTSWNTWRRAELPLGPAGLLDSGRHDHSPPLVWGGH